MAPPHLSEPFELAQKAAAVRFVETLSMLLRCCIVGKGHSVPFINKSPSKFPHSVKFKFDTLGRWCNGVSVSASDAQSSGFEIYYSNIYSDLTLDRPCDAFRVIPQNDFRSFLLEGAIREKFLI